MIRVPVLSPKGKPLMPAKASRVRRWLKAGKAKVVHNDLGIFQVQLTQPPSGEETQDIVAGIDPGKLFTGIAIQSAKTTLFLAHLSCHAFKVGMGSEQDARTTRMRAIVLYHGKMCRPIDPNQP